MLSLSFPISVMRAPIVSGSSVDLISTAVTTFDAWGGSTAVFTGANLNFQIPGGANYAVAVLFCAVLLIVAAAVMAAQNRSPRSQRPRLASGLVSVAAAVATGGLLAVAGCQLLAHQACVRPYQPGGLYGGGASAPEWELGWSCWLVTAGALIALNTCLILNRSATATMAETIEPELIGGEESPVGATTQATPSTPMERGPAATRPVSAHPPQTSSDPTPHLAELDPAIFRRPARNTSTTHPRETRT